MDLRRPVQLSCIALVALLTACGTPSREVQVRNPAPKVTMKEESFVNPLAVADTTIERELRFIVGSIVRAKEQPLDPTVEPSSSVPPAVDAPEPTSPWACIAEAETGSDYTMHGSVYSTAFGMVNDIIEDYGTPEEQQAVFSGTATPGQQIDIASRFAAENGFGGWGELTKQKCGL